MNAGPAGAVFNTAAVKRVDGGIVDVRRRPWWDRRRQDRCHWFVAALAVLALAGCETTPASPPADGAAPGAPGKPIALAPPAQKALGAEAARGTGPLAELSPLSDDIALQVEQPEIYRGTGVFARRLPVKHADVEFADDGDVTLNFANAEIREVVDAVLGQALGLSYIIDPKVEGQVTARTSMPIPRKSVIPALENILALNGAALTYKDGIYKIVTIQEAATGLSSPIVGQRGRQSARGFGIHILPVRFASAKALADVLRPFVGPGRVFRVDESRNLLVFAGTGPEARDLADMVRVFDVDWMSGMSFALFPVQVADAKAVVTDLETVFLKGGTSPLAGFLRFVPIERLNAVLVISPQAAYIDRAETWIDRLDRGGEGAGRRIFVYRVQNGRAADLATVLSSIFEAGGGGANAPGTGVAPGLDQVALGDQTAEPPAGQAQAGEQAGDGAPPAQPAAGSSGPLSLSGLAGIDSITESGNIRIIADERNNALVVLATAAEYRMIEATLKRLDITPLQVLIEVTIAEVTLNDDLRYGLQWFFNSGNSGVTLSSLSTGAVASAFPGFSYVFAPGTTRIVLNALSEITDVRVISSPHLMVLDNQSARLNVGDQVPIATQSSVSVTDPSAPIVNSIEFRDTGVILEVTPHVNASGLVTLDVMQEVSDVTATTTSDLNSPTIQQRSLQSTVAVQGGDTIALGGLIQDRDEKSVSGLPFLSEIPVLGNLFKATGNTQKRTELLVLITPRVVRDRREAREVTDELRERLRGIEPLLMKIKTPQ